MKHSIRTITPEHSNRDKFEPFENSADYGGRKVLYSDTTKTVTKETRLKLADRFGPETTRKTLCPRCDGEGPELDHWGVGACECGLFMRLAGNRLTVWEGSRSDRQLFDELNKTGLLLRPKNNQTNEG